MKIKTLFALTMITLGIFFTPLSFALNILLTNDDGIDATGIRKMKQELVGAGHTVTVVAPSENQSGTSAAVTLDLIAFEDRGDQEYAIEGTPATCVFIALNSIMADNPPDLVISGTNEGSNIASVAMFSGTVGATTTAINVLSRPGGPVPAIAVSANPIGFPESTEEQLDQSMTDVADFIVRLIAKLESAAIKTHRSLLPSGTRLNVNYPSLAPEDVRGVKMAVQGRGSDFLLGFSELELDGVKYFVPGIAVNNDGSDIPVLGDEPKDSDLTAFLDGYITIVPMDDDWTAPRSAQNTVKQAVKGLQP